MENPAGRYLAGPSATGYLFQCRYALLRGVQAIADSPELALSIEKFDDVTFDSRGEPKELIQTKHHMGTIASLSDASPDLWKTLLIWSKRIGADVEVPFRVKFVLLTTAVAPDGSAASLLRATARDEQEAHTRLLATASTSINQSNGEAYESFKSLPEQLRLNFLKAVWILDGSSNILDVREEIESELFHAVSRDRISLLVERLEGWWFNVVINALVGAEHDSIPVLAIDQRIDELREEFKRNALPVDYASATPTPAVVADLDKRPFVKQLRRIEVGTNRIEYAIRDYYRASEQRSRWAREDLLVDGELDNYERQLREAWQPRFAAMLEDISEEAKGAERVAAGKLLFKWAEVDAVFPLRSVTDRFLTHGSYHILANRYVVGWHPDFLDDFEEESDEGEA